MYSGTSHSSVWSLRSVVPRSSPTVPPFALRPSSFFLRRADAFVTSLGPPGHVQSTAAGASKAARDQPEALWNVGLGFALDRELYVTHTDLWCACRRRSRRSGGAGLTPLST